MEKKKRVSFGMFLVTIGIVYGDIGTSPLYVMKSILKGNGGIAHVNEDFILGALSLIIGRSRCSRPSSMCSSPCARTITARAAYSRCTRW